MAWMMSTTRSGRTYSERVKCCAEKLESVTVKPNVVTPLRKDIKVLCEEIIGEFEGNEIGDFDYAYSDHSGQCNILKSTEISPFMYSLPTESESDPLSGVELNFDKTQCEVKETTTVACEPESMIGKVIPLLPGVLRNNYGGILTCLPPLQILPSINEQRKIQAEPRRESYLQNKLYD